LWRAPVVQQRVKLGGDELAEFAQAGQQLAGLVIANQAHAACDPGQISVLGGQQVGLLIVQVLDPMFHPAQERVGLRQLRGVIRLHQTRGGEPVQRLQGGAGSHLRELPATHHEQQLHDELDLADAAARQLDVVGALGPPGGAALRALVTAFVYRRYLDYGVFEGLRQLHRKIHE
jgi:hypothetical protein